MSIPTPNRPLVIGLAGGIGSGKSEVARAFAGLGCVVIDSDKQAKAALERPDVRERLIDWWGEGIQNPDGTMNRRAIAEIVFNDQEQLGRLERLIHPMVRGTRSQLIDAATIAGAPAVIVDAPLLFEAGVDRECDVVVFVDAPRDVRLERVVQSRGWTREDFERREQAQIPLEEKRARADHTIENTGSAGQLAASVRAMLEKLTNPKDCA